MNTAILVAVVGSELFGEKKILFIIPFVVGFEAAVVDQSSVSLESVCRESVCRSQSLALLRSDSKVFVLQCQ